MIPKWLLCWIITILALGAAAFFFHSNGIVFIGQGIDSSILAATLVVWIVYVYYTYLNVKLSWMPSTTFDFKSIAGDPQHTQFIINNLSKLSIEAWGDFKSKIGGKDVSPGGFYAQKKPWSLQPYHMGLGHFEMKALAKQANTTLNKLKTNGENIHFSFSLKYKIVETGEEKTVGPEEYYFDTKNNILVRDV